MYPSTNHIIFCIDENMSFKWDFGGKNVFLKVIYMPKSQIGGMKVREFSYKMSQTDAENIYDFEVDVVSIIASYRILINHYVEY